MDERMKTRGDFGWRQPTTDGADTTREFYKSVVAPHGDLDGRAHGDRPEPHRRLYRHHLLRRLRRRMTVNPSIVRYPAAFNTITPTATSADAAIRPPPKRSPSASAPIAAAKITLVSRSVETAPNAVTLIAQTAAP